jgi:hypothetical protein
VAAVEVAEVIVVVAETEDPVRAVQETDAINFLQQNLFTNHRFFLLKHSISLILAPAKINILLISQ